MIIRGAKVWGKNEVGIVLQPWIKKRGLHYRAAEVYDLALFYELLE